MPKIILHPPGTTREEIEQRRIQENLKRTPAERMSFAFRLMALAMMLKKGPLKQPQGKGVVLKRKQQ
jgi:hypothetical protein